MLAGLISNESKDSTGWQGKIIIEPGATLIFKEGSKLDLNKNGRIILLKANKERGALIGDKTILRSYRKNLKKRKL